MKKILLCLAGLILISTLGYNVYQYQRNKNLSENLAVNAVETGEAADLQKDTVKNTEPVKSDEKDVNILHDELESTEDALDETYDQLTEELDKKKAFEEARAQFQKSITEDPAFKNSLKDALLQSIDSDYEKLYGRLELTPEQKEGFKKIVGDWRVENMDTADAARNAVTDEEKAEAYRIRDMKREKYKAQFIEVMGEENFNKYDDFKMSRFDRNTIERFMGTLPPESRMNNDDMDRLINKMHAERSILEKKYGFYDTIHFPSEMNEDYVKGQTDLATEVYSKYTEIGSEFLSPEQAEQYKEYIAKETEQYLSDVKMRAFMNGGN